MALAVTCFAVLWLVSVLLAHKEGRAEGIALAKPTYSSDIRPMDTDTREALTREYEAIISMIQDTGTLIWTINGAYLVALALVVSPAIDTLACPKPLPLKIAGSVVFLLSGLWYGSFTRNYAYYSLRIHHARSLEGKLGYSLFTNGHLLGDPPRVVVIEDREHRIAIPGRYLSIQAWTRLLIALFAVGGLLAIGWGWGLFGPFPTCAA